MFTEQKGKQLSKKIPELREIILYKQVVLPDLNIWRVFQQATRGVILGTII